MQRFTCTALRELSSGSELPTAYLVGVDGVPVRGEARVQNGVICCETRTQDALALSLLYPIKGFGAVQLETTRLPDREKPYFLPLELARHRLMRISLKREEWGLFDYSGMDEIAAEVDQSRDLFIQSMERADDPAAACRLGEESLRTGMWASERIALFHAGVFLQRRQQSGPQRNLTGVSLPSVAPSAAALTKVREVADFVRLPTIWREIQPKEHGSNYDALDALVQSASKAGFALRAGPLLSFGVQSVPDWMYIWENDYEAILEFSKEHVRRTVQRYASQIQHWSVACGLHGDNVFSFNFEQLMDLTRMAATITKQAAPRAHVVLDLTQPWGEYYARNQRTVPPLLYAEMAVQTGIPVDSFGLQFLFGIDSEGYRLRDLLQISALIDRLANLGKPLHITGLAVPSVSDGAHTADGGAWHTPWSEASQAQWLTAFLEVALSKPYVESVCLQTLSDSGESGIPGAGMMRADGTPKPAFQAIAEFRRRLQADR